MDKQYKQLSDEELLAITGGGLWEDIQNGVRDFFKGISDSVRKHSGF